MSKHWSNMSSVPADLTILVADGRLRPDEAEMLRTVTRQFRLRRAMLGAAVILASLTAGTITALSFA